MIASTSSTASARLAGCGVGLSRLPSSAQDEVLARARAALAPGGRIVIRDVDAASGFRGWLARAAERVGTALRVNRAACLEFRPARELVRRLEALGLECTLTPPADGSALGNALIVARAQGSRSSTTTLS